MNKNHIAKACSFSCLFALTITAILLLSCNNAVQANPAKLVIIGVKDFVPDTSNIKVSGLPDALVARITERLVKSKRFDVLERKVLRRIVNEQGFGKEETASDIDRLLDKAVHDLEKIGAGTLYVAGDISQKNDALNDFKKLGTMVGANYVVYAKLEVFERDSAVIDIPYNDNDDVKITENTVNAKLYLRIIESKKGNIIGADSLEFKISRRALSKDNPKISDLSVYDKVAPLVSNKILDIIFPAYVVDKNPYVINRGVNDGVKAGDYYDVIREGKGIKNSQGITLEKIKSVAGKIKVTNAQETISTVDVIDGNPIKGDLVVKTSAPNSHVSGGNDVPSAVKADMNLDNDGVKNKKPRISVGLIRSGSTARDGKKSDEHIPQFTDAIISNLTKTNRFIVIDRQEVGQLLKEQMAQAMAKDVPLPSTMGDLEGADYMIYGSLTNFNIEDKKSNVSVLNEEVKLRIGYVEGNMRIVASRTGEVLVSRKISIKEKLDTDIKHKLAAEKLSDKYAERVVANLINAVYPIKVAAVSGNGIYINRGKDGSLNVGDNLKVYRIEDRITDPDTGAETGFVETEIATIKIESTEDSTSKCSVVSGSNLEKGDVAKLIQTTIKTNENREVKKPNF